MARFILKPTLITYLMTAFIVTFTFLSSANSVGFNSDDVYLPALFSDIFVRGYHFFLWHLTPAPYFFPDMLVFFIIRALVHNVFYSFLVYAIFQNLLILFLISKIAFLVTKNKTAVLLTHIVFLLALIFVYPGNVEVYSIFLKSAYHVGTLINGLFLIWCLVSYSENAKNSTLLAIFFIGVLGAASDLVFIIQFVLPIMVSLLLCRLFRAQLAFSMAKIFLILAAGCLVGFSQRYFLADAQSHFVFILVHAFGVLETYHKILVIFKDVFFGNPFMGLMTLIFYTVLIIKCSARIFFKKNCPVTSTQKEWVFFLSLFMFTSAAFTCESMSINGILSARYLLNIFWFPIFFFWILFEKKSHPKILLMVLYAISIISIASKLSQNVSYHVDYMPEMVRCVDARVHEYNATHSERIKYGISTYWQAKLPTVFSQEGVVISQYNKDLSPFLWITSAENYRSAYDFAILSNDDKLDMNVIQQMNGTPSLTFKCDDKITLLIYGKNRLRVPHYQVKQ